MEPPAFTTFELDHARLSEADVRAEIIDPLLRSLGYRTGSENNIIREGQLRYDFLYLGRKTKNDMRLIGRPDYLLEIGGHGTILIEAKAGDRSLSNETVEQAKSYAIHPEVAAQLFVITNGLDFLVFSPAAKSLDDAIFCFSYNEIQSRWISISALLSPDGFRRSVRLPNFNTTLPLANGWPSAVRLGAGRAVPQKVNASIPMGGLDALANVTNHISRGRVERGTDGRIRAILDFSASTDFTQKLLDSRGLNQQTLETDDEFVSTSSDTPTPFRGFMTMSVRAGEYLFDMATWQPMEMPFDLTLNCHITAIGYVDGDVIKGTYSLALAGVLPFEMPGIGCLIRVEQVGYWEVDIIL